MAVSPAAVVYAPAMPPSGTIAMPRRAPTSVRPDRDLLPAPADAAQPVRQEAQNFSGTTL
jgi:hypothetical protein